MLKVISRFISRDERQDQKWSRRALAPKSAPAPTVKPLSSRGRPVSKRYKQSHPGPWTHRRNNDCYRFDDRVWNFHRFSGIIAVERCAGLAVARLGSRRLADDHGCAVLLGAGDDDAARRGCLCFSARGLRVIDWVLVWLDVVSRGSNGDYRGGSDCVREIPRRFCHSNFTG